MSSGTTPDAVKNNLCYELNANPDNFINNKFNFNHEFKIFS